MYFNEKEDTNIDSEFANTKKMNIPNINKKTLLFIGISLIILIIVIIIVIIFSNNSDDYTIELIGEEKIIITIGSDYIEPGYLALDKNGNDISNKVVVTSDIDYSKPGKYEIVYTIEGISVVRYITILENNHDTYIFLLGEKTIYLKVGEKYVEPGYNVYDKYDDKLNDKVVIDGKVNTSKKGRYTLTYSVTNRNNITITKTRTIVVE